MKKFLFLIILLLPLFASANNRIDINTASREQLETLTGIGPTYAQRIIDARPFSSIDELVEIKGIGEKTLQKIKDQGLAFVNVQPIEDVPETVIQEEKQEKVAEAGPPQIDYPVNVIFSKVMPSPKGMDSEEEYIEIKNLNDFEINLSGWKIRDQIGLVKTYTLNQKIKALGTLILKRPETKITLNNSGDGLELLNPNEKIIDSVDFGKAKGNSAFIKTSNGWQWDIKEKQPEARPRVVNEVEVKQEKREGLEIDLSKENPKQEQNGSLYLTAFLIALLFSVTFIILNKKLDREQSPFV